MVFNPNIAKQAQEEFVFFFAKTMKPFHLRVFFNGAPVERSISQKHLGLLQIRGWALVNRDQ